MYLHECMYRMYTYMFLCCCLLLQDLCKHKRACVPTAMARRQPSETRTDAQGAARSGPSAHPVYVHSAGRVTEIQRWIST